MPPSTWNEVWFFETIVHTLSEDSLKVCTINHSAPPDTHASSYSPKLLAAILFKHVKANNDGFESVYSISRPLPLSADTDAWSEGEGSMRRMQWERGVKTFRRALGLDTEMLHGAEQKLLFWYLVAWHTVPCGHFLDPPARHSTSLPNSWS